MTYRRYSRYLRDRFGAKVYKVSVDAGFTCPTLDGTKARGGCAYCNNASFKARSVSRRLWNAPPSVAVTGVVPYQLISTTRASIPASESAVSSPSGWPLA